MSVIIYGNNYDKIFHKTPRRPDWYLTGVKEKENKDWSHAEMIRVYTMRMEDKKPVKEIAEALGVSKCQVNNVTRIIKKAIRMLCYTCGSELSKDELKSKKPGRIVNLCFKCRKEAQEYKHERRQKFLDQGMCGYCGKNEKLPDRDACTSCLSATHRRRERVGLCGNCGKKPIRPGYPKGALCDTCAAMMSVERKPSGVTV
jgi:hypothetical protein